MNIIVAGSRNFTDYGIIKTHLKATLRLFKDVVIISGDARGPDKLAVKYVIECHIPYRLFPADWNKYPKAGGHIRNRDMLKIADGLIAFWDGKSTGTKDMINISKKKNIKIIVIRIDS